MRILSLAFLLMSYSLNAQETAEEVDYSHFDQELQYLEEAARKEEEKLLQNVDKISEEKVESSPVAGDAVTDVVSTKMAAEGPAAAPVIPPPPVEKPRRIRSR